MTLIYIVSMIIIVGVILLSVLTINKGYRYQHTIDSVPKPTEENNTESNANND